VRVALSDDDSSVRLASADAIAALVSTLPIQRIDALFEQLVALLDKFADAATLSALTATLKTGVCVYVCSQRVVRVIVRANM
jgi:hypothetical protein